MTAEERFEVRRPGPGNPVAYADSLANARGAAEHMLREGEEAGPLEVVDTARGGTGWICDVSGTPDRQIRTVVIQGWQ